MKRLKFEKLVEIHGGGKNRSCMILGGLTLGSALAAPFTGVGGGGVVAFLAGAVLYGCFD